MTWDRFENLRVEGKGGKINNVAQEKMLSSEECAGGYVE